MYILFYLQIMSSNNKQISYAELFRNRFKKHDTVFKDLIKEPDCPKASHRRKRNYNDAFAQGSAGTAFAQNAPYTRFTDEFNTTRS